MTDQNTTPTEPDFGLLKPVVYLVDGELEVGTLRSYAGCLRHAYYEDIDVKGPWIFHVHETPTHWPQTGQHVVVYNVTLERREPTSTSHDYDDYRVITLELDGETAGYTIDLRA